MGLLVLVAPERNVPSEQRQHFGRGDFLADSGHAHEGAQGPRNHERCGKRGLRGIADGRCCLRERRGVRRERIVDGRSETCCETCIEAEQACGHDGDRTRGKVHGVNPFRSGLVQTEILNYQDAVMIDTRMKVRKGGRPDS